MHPRKEQQPLQSEVRERYCERRESRIFFVDGKRPHRIETELNKPD